MNIFAVVAFLSSTGAAMFYRTDTSCDFTDVAIDNEVFSRIIAKLPEDMEIGPQDYRPSAPWSGNAPCDFTDVMIDNKVISELIAKLPEYLETGVQEYRPLIPGLEVGGLVLHDLNRMRQLGAAIPHCVNGSRMVQVDFYSHADTRLSAPWKTCSGDEGRITIRPMFARFTLQFRVVESNASGVKLEFDSDLPVTALSVRVRVDGAGSMVRGVFEILSGLLPTAMEDIWFMQFHQNIGKAFRMINE
ncbi:hypothetical protein HPB50_027086 [Hyalomma asiaticum]|uniref:Uncharacterized protein n=1 Tax=Hyalomma asiaticum TaxID=266040 RepID=A0ACB7S1V1_HYAAI|nr:hypothetical protein HPB50_027086 [Hyalomma asiaticum]